MDYNYWITAITMVAIQIMVILVPKGMLTAAIYKERYSKKSLSITELIDCYIPFRNSYIIKHTVDGESGFFKWSNIIVGSLTGLLFVVKFAFPVSADKTFLLIQFAATIAIWLVLFIAYVLEIILLWDMCNVIDARHLKWSVFLPAFSAILLYYRVAPFFKKYRATIDGTFSSN